MKIIGYIVLDEESSGMLLGKTEDGRGVLEWEGKGDSAVLFSSREDAELAIARSQEYARERGWQWGPYRIIAVVE